MHIGLVTPQYPAGLSANGISTYTELMAEELARKGHCVSVFSRGATAGSASAHAGFAENIDVYHVGTRSLSVPVLRTLFYRAGGLLCPGYIHNRDSGVALRDAVLRAHRTTPLDVVECPEVRGLPDWLESLGIPIVVRLHAARTLNAVANGEPRDRVFRGIFRAERHCLRRARHVSAPCHAIVAETTRVLGIELQDARVIPNPISPVAPTHTAESNGDPHEVLFVGRMDIRKGFDVFVRAFHAVASRPEFADIHATIVGPDSGLILPGRPAVSGSNYLCETVVDGGIRSRIDLRGPLPHDRVATLRHRRILTVIPSRFENFPYTLLEAMAAGCPVIAADSGGIPEIIRHEQNGLLFRSGESEALAEQLARLVADKALKSALGSQAGKDIEEFYSPAVVADTMVSFYREVCDRT
ncbi:MAG: glycosyltransferase family 4 protein [Phycisphaerales bacterium]|nr:MAG: glycosyltransferase family 4 protein [Phycisphaerales bacterium]